MASGAWSRCARGLGNRLPAQQQGLHFMGEFGVSRRTVARETWISCATPFI
jgi:hypothetical protein